MSTCPKCQSKLEQSYYCSGETEIPCVVCESCNWQMDSDEYAYYLDYSAQIKEDILTQ